MADLKGKRRRRLLSRGATASKHSLADYAGKNVILWFYPKDDTPG